MKRWLQDLWDGFFTVLVGMKITWRHMFTDPVTLQYPTVKWPLPPKSRMRLFMKFEDCIGCGQCVRACPVNFVTSAFFALSASSNFFFSSSCSGVASECSYQNLIAPIISAARLRVLRKIAAIA